jgi:hypothetical protein
VDGDQTLVLVSLKLKKNSSADEDPVINPAGRTPPVESSLSSPVLWSQ